jgi:hypothetical protein
LCSVSQVGNLWRVCYAKLIIIFVDSLKYHRLHPEYIHQRIERLGHSYNLRILLLLCDVVSSHYISVFSTVRLKRVGRVNTKIPYVNLQR